MALEPKDFMLPNGELNEEWFPDVETTTFLEARIDDAESDPRFADLDPTPQAAARRAYVYEQAYRHIYRRKSEDPLSWSADGQGSEQQSDRQVERWRELAERKQSKWERHTESGGKDDRPTSTTSVPSHTGYA